MGKNSKDVNSFWKFYDKIYTELRRLENLDGKIENISNILYTTLLKAISHDLLLELNKVENEQAAHEFSLSA